MVVAQSVLFGAQAHIYYPTRIQLLLRGRCMEAVTDMGTSTMELPVWINGVLRPTPSKATCASGFHQVMAMEYSMIIAMLLLAMARLLLLLVSATGAATIFLHIDRLLIPPGAIFLPMAATTTTTTTL